MSGQKSQRRVGVLLETIEFHHGIFVGILQYARMRNWIIHREPPTVEGLERLAKSGMEGVIGKVTEPDTIPVALKTGLPIVNISAANQVAAVPGMLVNVLANDPMIGQLAADHLVSYGAAHYGYAGQGNMHFVRVRAVGFRQRIGELGCGHAYSEAPVMAIPEPAGLAAANTPHGKWLVKMPKPAAIFCSSDLMAFAVHRVARDCGIDLLKDVVLLGCDNQLDYCEAVHPAISSIELGMTGFRAAEILDRMLMGKPVRPTLLVPPKGIIRRDFDRETVQLPAEVQAVMSLIASRIGEQLQVSDLLNVLPLSRRHLEKRFKDATGRTIYQEIQKQRVDRAAELLRTTQWPVERIGDATGFTDPRHFSRVFRQLRKCSPRAYRRRR